MPPAPVFAVTAPEAREHALAALQAGNVIVIPTDTVYAAAALPTDSRALRRLWRACAVPWGTAPPVLLSGAHLLGRFAAHNPPAARRLAGAFWPGPLTLVLRRAPGIRGEGAGASDTVALRVPAHAPLCAIIDQAGGALVAIGIPKACTVADAVQALAVRPALALDGGDRPGGDSSIVDCSRAPYRLLREGVLTRDQLARVARSRLF